MLKIELKIQDTNKNAIQYKSGVCPFYRLVKYTGFLLIDGGGI